jgi:DME family drug/metabolite transporter
VIGELAALSAAFCWALSAVLYKKVLQKTGYLAVNLVRSSFAVLFLLLLLPFIPFQSSVLTFNELGLLVFAAVTNLVIGDTFYFIGLKKVGVSRAQPISSSYPLYSMLLAALILSESLTVAVLVGTPLVVAGTIITSLASSDSGPDKNSKSLLRGVLASIAAAIFWSIGLVTYKIALTGNGIDTSFATFIRTAAILPFLLVMIIGARESSQLTKLSRIDTVALAIAGILALGVGGVLLFLSLSLIDAARAIPLSSISPLLSLVLARQYSGEKVTMKVIIGTALIVTGVVLITFLGQQ